MKTEVIPAILARSVSDLEGQFSELPPEVKFVHLDVLEEDIWTETKLDFEVHLMVKEPEKIVDKWIERGAERIIVHKLEKAMAKPVEIGLAVELQIPLEEIFPLLGQVDFVHLMSIAKIGEQGHPFRPEIFDRIKELKEKFPQIPISVDGGINVSNYQALEGAGVARLIVGSGFKELWPSLTRN